MRGATSRAPGRARAVAVLGLLVLANLSAPPPAVSSPGDPVSFSDGTTAQGLLDPLRGMYAHATAFGDVNQDGWQDLFVGTFADYPDTDYLARGAAGRSPDRLLLGGPGGFTVDTTFPTMFGRTSAGVFADLENTGFPDLVVVRHTLNDNDQGRAPTVVLHNDRGRFTAPKPLPQVLQGRVAGVLDYDGDGLADLFVSHDSYFDTPGASVLLRNHGNLEFEDVTARVGLSGIRGMGVGAADLNADGRADLAVATTSPTNGTASSPALRLFVNSADGTFHETGNAVFRWDTYAAEDYAAGVTVGDLNRDGRPDLVVGQHFDSTLQLGTTASIHAYLNTGTDARGDPTFADITSASGLPPLSTKSPDVQIADFDDDGWPDILTTASSSNGTRPTVFRNLGVAGDVPRFATPAGLGNAHYWVNGSVADVDGDGRLDVFVTDFDPAAPSLLFHNDTPAGHWLEVSVDGAAQGLGARVEVYSAGRLGDPSALLGVTEIVAATGFGTGVPARTRLGLGATTLVDVRVKGPNGGAVVDRRSVVADQRVRVGLPATTVPTTTTVPPATGGCPCSLWPPTATPGSTYASGQEVELGVKFSTDVGGVVTALRFYKAPGDTGPHTAHLWSATGSLLASASFSGETGSGWQQVTLPTPVAVAAGTAYVASYHSSTGTFAYDFHTFDAGRDASPLHAPASAASGGNGVYRYGPSAFPNQSVFDSNYWADVVFTTTVPTATTTTTTTTTTTVPPATGGCPCSLWPPTAAPGSTYASGQEVELGVKFSTDVGGVVTALRFYKAPGDTGPHTAHLWSATGSLLASASFSGETGSGWQQVTLPTPVAVAAGTAYVASYHSSTGTFAYDFHTFDAGRDASPLHAPASAASGGNGVYRYGPSAFPNQSVFDSNYWADVVFTR